MKNCDHTECDQAKCIPLDDFSKQRRQGGLIWIALFVAALFAQWGIEQLIEVHPADVRKELRRHNEEMDERFGRLEQMLRKISAD